MIKKNKQSRGFILKINEDSQIQEVIFSSVNNGINFKEENFTKYIDEGSLQKYFSILKEVQEKEVVFGREINLKFGEKLESYIFVVLNNLDSDSVLIAANQSEGIIKYYEELMKINNKYVNNLRRSIKDKIAEEKPFTENEIYNEMSSLNNELVNMQRKLNKQNRLLEAQKEKYRITLANIAEGVITAGQDDQIVYLNSKAEEMLQWSLDNAKDKSLKDVFEILIKKSDKHGVEIISEEINEAEAVKISLSELLAEKGEINNQEAILTSKNDENVMIEFSAAYVGKKEGKVIIFREISQRKDMEKRLKKYASTDLLTEVLNRRAGLDYLQKEMERAAESQDVLSVIFIDVNDLKLVNDNFGHQEGDELLQRISVILQHSLRRNDKVVRLGGDEFLLILPQSDRDSAEKIWLRIKEEIKEASELNEKNYKISASHGAAEYSPDYNKSLDQLINQADREMYGEKKKMKS